MNVASSEAHAHVVSVSEGTSRCVGPACSPCLACGGWLGCLCISSRAREEGALCRTLSENTARGVPVSGLWDPRWIPRGGGARPHRPARSLRSCPRLPWPVGRSFGRGPRPGSAGEARPVLGGGSPGRRPSLLSSAPPLKPYCQTHLVPGTAVGLLLRFPCELVFLIFQCFLQLIELNL